MSRKPERTQAEQGTKHEGLIGKMRLLTPTQTQWTRNDLETELLIQIAFSRRVSDALTQPILEVGKRRIVPSMVFRLHTDLADRPLAHLVEVDAEDGRLDAATLDAGRAWCAQNGAGFHVLDARTIRTDRLANARLMTPYVGFWPMDEDVGTIDAAMRANGDTTTIAAATEALVADGVPRQDAECVLCQVVANWFFECDLSTAYDGASILKPLDPRSHLDSRQDPFLSFLDTGTDGT